MFHPKKQTRNALYEKFTETLARAGFRQDFDNISHIASGMLNHIYLIEYDRLGHRIILRERHAPDSEYSQCYCAERFVYPLLDRDLVPVPELLYFDEKMECFKNCVSILEYVPGLTFYEWLKREDNERSIELCVEDIATAIASIHEVKHGGFSDHGRNSFENISPCEYWRPKFFKEARKLQLLSTRASESWKHKFDLWISEMASFSDELLSPRLVHGDMHGKNIIIRNGKAHFIDWESSRFRSPAYDFVQLSFVDFSSRPKLMNRLLSRYLEVSQTNMNISNLTRLIHIFSAYWKVRMLNYMAAQNVQGDSFFGTVDDFKRSILSD